MQIKPEQLRIAPPAEVCREMAISAPELRKVNTLLQVSYRGALYDVRNVPDVMVNEKLLITRNPWRDGESAQAVLRDENGHQTLYVIERLDRDEYGFIEGAAVLGEEHKRHAETPAQVTRKLLEQLATGTDSEEAAAKARKAKVTPFGNTIDPHKHLTDTSLPTYLPKRGTELETRVTVATVEIKPLTVIEAAKALRARMGSAWNAEHLATLKADYPNGVPEAELDAIHTRLTAPARPGLRLVVGE